MYILGVPNEKRPFPGGENYRKYASWYATGYPNELEHYSLEGNTTWNSTWKQQRRREYVCAMVAWRNDALCFLLQTNVLICWFVLHFTNLV